MGDRVPDVIMTLWNRSKIGFIAIEASRQQKYKIGFDTVGALSLNGSIMITKPLVYVDTRVAKCETTTRGEYSATSEISKVRSRDASLSALNRKGLRSIHTFWKQSFKKAAGDSCTTCCTRRRTFKYSMNLFRNPTKCSAVRIFPGMASIEQTEIIKV